MNVIKSITTLIISSLLLAIVNISSAEENCYKLDVYDYETGRAGNYPVCRAFLTNLNRFCDVPVPLNRVLISPNIPKLVRPKWTVVPDFHRYIDAIATAKNTIKGEESYRRLESSLKSGNSKMWIGQLNLDNHGSIETVIRLNSGVPVVRGYNMLVPIDLKTGKYDDTFERISTRPYDALIYDGRTFLFEENNWWDLSRGYEIYLNEPHHAGTAPGVLGPVCVFAYNPKPSTSEKE